jgi:hypothetical protein
VLAAQAKAAPQFVIRLSSFALPSQKKLDHGQDPSQQSVTVGINTFAIGTSWRA